MSYTMHIGRVALGHERWRPATEREAHTALVRDVWLWLDVTPEEFARHTGLTTDACERLIADQAVQREWALERESDEIFRLRGCR